jgi:hypothetical protein
VLAGERVGGWALNPIFVFLFVFVCTFGGALFGMWLRGILPEHHLDGDSKDTVVICIGLVASMTALILGLVTASAKSSFDDVDAAMKKNAIEILTVDRMLARYGPETGEIRAGLKQLVQERIDMIWPQDASRPAMLDPMSSNAMSEAKDLTNAIRALEPRNDTQKELKTRALDLVEDLLQSRWLMILSSGNSVPVPFLVISICWLTIIFESFGLFAPRHATVLVVFFVCALSVGSVVYLILEMGTPFDGLLKVPADTFLSVYAHLGK